MSGSEVRLQRAERILAAFAKNATRPYPDLLTLTIGVADLLSAVVSLREAHWGYLAAITGVDLGPEKGEIEVLYHFCDGPAVLALRVLIPRDCPTLPSVCSIISSASFLERELIEMLGVTVIDTPVTDHLFLPDDWPEGSYPLRKDFVIHEETNHKGNT